MALGDTAKRGLRVKYHAFVCTMSTLGGSYITFVNSETIKSVGYFACSPEEFCEYFFVFAWEFCIEKWRGFLVNFFWSPSPTKARKILENFRENSEQNSGQNSGRNIEKFGKLSFCNFPDLSVGVSALENE